MVAEDSATERLALLKKMRTRLREVIFDEDTLPRELASLSRRLQIVSHDIVELEEKLGIGGGDAEHLRLMRRMEKMVSKVAFCPKTAPRDLSSLTNRLQDLAAEIATLQERAKMEGRQIGSTSTAETAIEGATFDPESV